MGDTTEQRRYWKRAGYVAIQDRGGNMVRYGGSYDSLDFKFSGEKTGDIYRDFTVGILGLSLDTINDLTAWGVEGFKRKRRIQVFAGYDIDALANPIFDGFIVEAIPTSPPDMWLNMKCMINFDNDIPVDRPRSFCGTIDEIFKEIAKELGLGSRIEAKKIDSEKEYTFTIDGTRTGLARKFADAFDLTVVADNGVLIAYDKRPWLDDPKNQIELSMDTGLLGIGSLTVTGLVARMRLNDYPKMGSWMKLKSTLIPQANGDYCVIKKRHIGHYRGDDWYTELKCIRKM